MYACVFVCLLLWFSPLDFTCHTLWKSVQRKPTTSGLAIINFNCKHFNIFWVNIFSDHKTHKYFYQYTHWGYVRFYFAAVSFMSVLRLWIEFVEIRREREKMLKWVEFGGVTKEFTPMCASMQRIQFRVRLSFMNVWRFVQTWRKFYRIEVMKVNT